MNDSDEEESDHEDFEVSRNFLEKQKEEYENDGNIEFLEVDNSYKRLFDCFYDGGDREFAIGKIADSCDVKTILLFLKYTANVREEHFLSCMKLCVSWLKFIAKPTLNRTPLSKYAEERACIAFFKAPLSRVKADTYRCYKEVDGEEVLMDEELLQEGYKTTKENIILIDMFRRGLIKIWSGLKVGDDDSIQDFDLGPFKNYILLASDQIECHQKVLSAAISSSQRLQHRPIEWKTMGNLTKFITVDTKEPDQDKESTLYHAREIFLYMLNNSLKRFQRRAYVPKPNENSAGINHARFAEVVGCDGIYKAVSINKHVVKVVFDTVQGKVLEGIYYPWNEQKKLKLPPNCEIGIECKHAYRGERCCDLMHCKHKCGEEFCMWRGGTWMNPRKEDISKMRDSHIFEPKFSPGKTIVTHGYKKYMTIDEFINWWFSINHNPEAVVDFLSTKNNLLTKIKEYLSTTHLPECLDLVPNDHIFMFNEGYLVCEHDQVEKPEFFSLGHPFFKSGGKFYKCDTIQVYESIAFRADKYQSILENNASVVSLRNTEICMECGWPKNVCEAWQENFEHAFDTEMPPSIRDIQKWYDSEYEDGNFYDELQNTIDELVSKNFICCDTHFKFIKRDSNGNIQIDKTFLMWEHKFTSKKPLNRYDGTSICNNTDLGVMDDMLLFQYDYTSPWIKLPKNLRVADANNRFYKKQVERMRNEIYFQFGRLYYRKNEYKNRSGESDKTQNMLGTIGVGNTGKSTALNMVKRGMNTIDTQVLDCATFEEKFGLSQIMDSKFVAINEVETDSRTLTPGLIKQMCDDSIMSAPQKGRDVRLGMVCARIWFLGNERLFSNDSSGALSRRIAQMHWGREVYKQDIDPQLEKKFNLHFGHLIAVLHLKYWEMMEKFSGKDFWFKEGDDYPFMSWVWHEIRRSNEEMTAKLTKAFNDWQDTPSIWKFSPATKVDLFEFPETEYKNGQRVLKCDRASSVNADWWDYEGEEDEVKRKIPIAYMPWEDAMDDSGRKCSGLKSKYLEKLKQFNPGGKIKKEDINWEKGFDFYGRPLDKAGLRLENTFLPWPIEDNKCIKKDWLIGCTIKMAFQAEGQQDDDSFENKNLWENLEDRRSEDDT